MLAHTSRALQLLFQAIAEVDTLDELARVGMVAVELYEGDAAVLRELMQAIEARATVVREQLRLFPAPRVEPPPSPALEPAPQELVREWCAQVQTMGPDELNAIDESRTSIGNVGRCANSVGQSRTDGDSSVGSKRFVCDGAPVLPH